MAFPLLPIRGTAQSHVTIRQHGGVVAIIVSTCTIWRGFMCLNLNFTAALVDILY